MLKIGITMRTELCKSIFSNGIGQNILFIYDYLNSMKNIEVTLILDKEMDMPNKKMLITDFENIKKFDSILWIGLITTPDKLKILKENDVKNICWKMGDDFIYDYHSIIDKTRPCSIACSIGYDEVWISPHFKYAIDYYKYICKTDNVTIAPYIWSEEFIKGTNPSNNYDKLNIGILEPNQNWGKNCIIPTIISEKSKEYINKSLILSSEEIFNENENFKYFVNWSSLFQENRMSCEKRHSLKKVVENYCNIIVSWVDRVELNYLFMECFYLGVPLIHNSKILKDYGFYYEDCNVDQAVAHIKNIKENGFDRDEYIARHKNLLEKYSFRNPINKIFLEKKLGIKFEEDLSKKNDTLDEEDLSKKNDTLDEEDLSKKNDTLDEEEDQPQYNREKQWWFEPHEYNNLENYNHSKWGHCITGTIKNEEIISINRKSDKKHRKIYSFIISNDDKLKFHMMDQVEEKYIFIDYEVSDVNFESRKKNHMKCWQQALDMGLQEIYIFEDNITLIKNWRSLICELLDFRQVDIIKFDALPYKDDSIIDDKNLKFYKCYEPWCTGGYYITRRAMETALKFYNEGGDEPDEMFLAKAIQEYHDSIYTTVPRICIQNFKDDKLKFMINDEYLPKFKDFYNI